MKEEYFIKNFAMKKKLSITNIGTVSLLMIFIILCMVTFAALSLSSAAADHRFSQKMADHSKSIIRLPDRRRQRLLRKLTIYWTSHIKAPSLMMITISRSKTAFRNLGRLQRES